MIEYTRYETEQAIRSSIISALASACHPDHLRKVRLLTDRLEKHMIEDIQTVKNLQKTIEEMHKQAGGTIRE